ncbi:unnamed protein product [Ceutorhynchus assimilis]|uniref:Myb-like domain-containing protein n=1 Tax=Ceutorhynchus assimilis TaxID=467358 RepID=A0A9N9MDB7_9CUCU|nr:unnamed protein product [Ceutorhynchus assimilis]
MSLKFKINEELITLFEPEGESDHLFKITNDDTFTVQYLTELVNNDFISLREPMSKVYRVAEDGSERQIYPLLANGYDFFDSLIETEKENTQTQNIQNCREITFWNDEETKILLDTYEEFMSKVGRQKKFKTKKSMWSKIAEILNRTFGRQTTGNQFENRYKTVLKRKKAAVDNNKKSGNSRAIIPFEEELTKIASLDDSILPEIVGTAQSIKVLKSSNNNTSCTSTSYGTEERETESPQPKKRLPEDFDSTPKTSAEKRLKPSVQDTLWKKRRGKRKAPSGKIKANQRYV